MLLLTFKTKNIEPHQSFIGSYKQSVNALDEVRHKEKINREKKVNKLRRKLFDQHKVKFKSKVCLKEKETDNNK